MTHLTGLDQTVQKTNEWLRDIGKGLGRHSFYYRKAAAYYRKAAALLFEGASDVTGS